MMKKIILILIIALTALELKAQSKGGLPDAGGPDTTFIFKSPRPLLKDPSKDKLSMYAGFDMLISESGYGAAFIWGRDFTENFSIFLNIGAGGARNTDEIEQWQLIDGVYQSVVPNKVNRVYMFPTMVSARMNLFSGSLTESFKPYVSGGLGPVFVVSTPYEREFFNALHYAQGYTRFGAFLGTGAVIGVSPRSAVMIGAKYYYIPFGGKGIESVKDNPIKDLGGLSLSIGMTFGY